MAFIGDVDKLIVRMGAEIVFMEQMIAQLQQENASLKANMPKEEQTATKQEEKGNENG